MDKKIKSLCTTDDLIVIFSIAIICGNIGFIIAKTLEISPGQMFNSAAIGSGIAALSVLTVATIARVLSQKKKKIAIYTEKLEN